MIQKLWAAYRRAKAILSKTRGLFHALKTLGKFQVFGLICGAYCATVTALCMTFPKLLTAAQRLM